MNIHDHLSSMHTLRPPVGWSLRTSPENPLSWLSQSAEWFDTWASGGGVADSGQTVSDQTAVRVAAVWACEQCLSSSMASLPVGPLRLLEGGGKEKAKDHPLWPILHEQPNPNMSSFTWVEVEQLHVTRRGNAYSLIERSGRGSVIALWPLSPSDVETVPTDDGTFDGGLSYRVRGLGAQIPARDMLHIPGLGWDGITGYSPLTIAREVIGLGLAAQAESAKSFSMGSRVQGVLSTDKPINAEQRSGALASWNAAQRSKTAVAVLGSGLKYDRMSMTSEEAQFVERQKFTVEEIARIYRIPPHKIGHLEKATFSNIEAQQIQFVTDTLVPLIGRWEGELNRKLLTPAERKRYVIKFNVAGLLRGELKARFEAYSLAINANKPWMSVNQIRDLEDWNPVEGGDDMSPPINATKPKADAAAAA